MFSPSSHFHFFVFFIFSSIFMAPLWARAEAVQKFSQAQFQRQAAPRELKHQKNLPVTRASHNAQSVQAVNRWKTFHSKLKVARQKYEKRTMAGGLAGLMCMVGLAKPAFSAKPKSVQTTPARLPNTELITPFQAVLGLEPMACVPRIVQQVPRTNQPRVAVQIYDAGRGGPSLKEIPARYFNLDDNGQPIITSQGPRVSVKTWNYNPTGIQAMTVFYHLNYALEKIESWLGQAPMQKANYPLRVDLDEITLGKLIFPNAYASLGPTGQNGAPLIGITFNPLPGAFDGCGQMLNYGRVPKVAMHELNHLVHFGMMGYDFRPFEKLTVSGSSESIGDFGALLVYLSQPEIRADFLAQTKGNMNRKNSVAVLIDPQLMMGVALRNHSVRPTMKRFLGQRLWGRAEDFLPLLQKEVDRDLDQHLAPGGSREALKNAAHVEINDAWAAIQKNRHQGDSATQAMERALIDRFNARRLPVPTFVFMRSYERALLNFGAGEVMRDPGDYHQILNAEVMQRTAFLKQKGIDIQNMRRDLSQFEVLNRGETEEHRAGKALASAMYDVLTTTIGRSHLAGASQDEAVRYGVERVAPFFYRGLKHHVKWTPETTWDDIGQGLIDASLANAPDLTGSVLQSLTTHGFNVHMPRALDVAPVAAQYLHPVNNSN